jgi:hypothetical protein
VLVHDLGPTLCTTAFVGLVLARRVPTPVSHRYQDRLILTRPTILLSTFPPPSRRSFLLTYLGIFGSLQSLQLSALWPLSDKGGGDSPEFHSLVCTMGLPSCEGQMTCLSSSATSDGEGSHGTLAL